MNRIDPEFDLPKKFAPPPLSPDEATDLGERLVKTLPPGQTYFLVFYDSPAVTVKTNLHPTETVRFLRGLADSMVEAMALGRGPIADQPPEG